MTESPKSRLQVRCRHRFESGFELDVDLLSEHTVTSLFGPSGSGKSTILQIVAGMLQADSARVELNGRVITDTESRAHVAPESRHVGYVFQDQMLFPHMSIRRNLQYGSKRRSQGSMIAFDRVVTVLELAETLDRRPAQLSGGQCQRVALGRALLSRPELLIMDEPLAALDHELKTRIIGYLERIVEEWHVPTLFVSHSQGEVRKLADTVFVLDRGRILAHGPPEETLSQPESWSGDYSHAPTNVLRVDSIDRTAQGHRGRVGEQWLTLPPGESSPDATMYVEFSANDVIVSRKPVHGLSSRNHLAGTIRRIIERNARVDIAVDVGQLLWARITPESTRELELANDVDVVCHIKSNRLRLL